MPAAPTPASGTALLFTAKSTDRLGRVEDGNTVCDYDPEEAKRRASLSLAVAPVEDVYKRQLLYHYKYCVRNTGGTCAC